MNCLRIAAAIGFAAICYSIPVLTISQGSPPAQRTTLTGSRSLGAPRTFKNLTLIPVYDTAAKAGNVYVTLDEGLKAKSVKVQESKQGGDVNTLYITNTGPKPLYIMAG